MCLNCEIICLRLRSCSLNIKRVVKVTNNQIAEENVNNFFGYRVLKVSQLNSIDIS